MGGVLASTLICILLVQNFVLKVCSYSLRVRFVVLYFHIVWCSLTEMPDELQSTNELFTLNFTEYCCIIIISMKLHTRFSQNAFGGDASVF